MERKLRVQRTTKTILKKGQGECGDKPHQLRQHGREETSELQSQSNQVFSFPRFVALDKASTALGLGVPIFKMRKWVSTMSCEHDLDSWVGGV